MTKINNEVKTIFERQLAVIANVSKDGIPNAGPKGSMFVFDDESLVYAEGTGEKTLKNIQQNQSVAVLVVDKEKGDGYQVKGVAEILTRLGAVPGHSTSTGTEKETTKKIKAWYSSRVRYCWPLRGHLTLHCSKSITIDDSWPGIFYSNRYITTVDCLVSWSTTPDKNPTVSLISQYLMHRGH